MYVTQRSFAAPVPTIRDFFWLYHTYSLLRGGFYNASSGFGPEANTLRGQLLEEQRCFNALTFRGIDMLLDHITVGPFKNSSLTSLQNISWNCLLFSYFIIGN